MGPGWVAWSLGIAALLGWQVPGMAD
ncbi:hypothetical protein SPHINGO8AM_40106 [Sphingomonas sp. 8AM]|nr:hypothetical protein SPHINGO8AM_40106 [Sphingomonas sp. 8AM]